MNRNQPKQNYIFNIFAGLVFASLLVPLLFTSSLLYPFVSSKALLFRSLMVLALPLYIFLIFQLPKYRPNFKNPVTWSVLAFAGLALVSGFLGVNAQRSFWGNYERMDGNYNLLCLLCLYFYILLLFAAREFLAKKFLLWMLGVAALASLYGLMEKFGLTFFEDAALPVRASSTFGNPIFFGSFVVLPAFVSAFFAAGEQNKNYSLLYWIFSALSFIGIVVSGTRGALLGVVIALAVFGLVFLLFNENKIIKKRGFVLLAVFILIFGTLFFYGQRKLGDVTRLFNLSDSNAKARLIQWQSALKGFKEHPLMGVGPQNYYVIANKYFNPEIYKYDNTWFDKPHNYLLEILLTNGLLGFLAYAGIILFTWLAFWKAYKAELITWFECCLLAAGALAYQIQNLFAFDTTSAAWVFFIFTAFAAYLWQIASNNSPDQTGKAYNSAAVLGGLVVGVLALYVFFVTNVITAKVLYNLNIAYALGLNNPQIAEQYYERAESQSFIYDPGDVALKHSEFAVSVGQDLSGSLDKNFVADVLSKATSMQEGVVGKITNNPIYWYHLANNYNTVAIINNTPPVPRAVEAVNNAVALAPNRVEPKFFLVQIYGLEKNIPKVVEVSEQIVRQVPFYPEAKWRLATAYKDDGRTEEAVAMANEALAAGYRFKLAKEPRWLINYYADKQDYARVAELYEQAIKLAPSDYQLYASLATVYAKLGQKDKAITAAEKVLELNPASKPSVEEFLKTLQ